MEVIPYSTSLAEAWNEFNRTAKNSTFLLDRGYMDYHADRFKDASLAITYNGTLKSILPLSLNGTIRTSHGGLTYGGVILPTRISLKEVLQYYELYLKYLYHTGCTELRLKPAPSFYNKVPAFEHEYAMHLLEGHVYRVDTGSVVDLAATLQMQQRKLRNVKKAEINGLQICKTTDVTSYWAEVLSPNLSARHKVNPVHTADEMNLLQSRFPNYISCYTVHNGADLLAGTVLFSTSMAVHAQYIAATPNGKELGALDFLFTNLLSKFKATHRYFSFGISTENNGLMLNKGLTEWKEGFGAYSWNNLFYSVQTRNYSKLTPYCV